MILHEKTKQEFGYEFEACKVYDNFYCICDYCGVEFLRSKRNILSGRSIVDKESCNSKKCAKLKREESCSVKHGVKNAGGTPASVEKIKNTTVNKFGVTNVSKLEVVKNKVKNTCRKKYGKSSYLETDECREEMKSHRKQNKDAIEEKMKQTCKERYGEEWYSSTDEAKKIKVASSLAKYGVENPTQSKEVKDKIKDTVSERYGVDHYSKTDSYKEKVKETCLEKYGVDHYLKTEEGKNKVRDTVRQRYGVNNPLQNKEILQKLIATKIERYGFSFHRPTGKTEDEIKTWINSFGFNFRSDTSLLQGKELDLYDDEVKLAVEFCGNYWHTELSPEPRGRDYHASKYRICKSKGVRLITLFEDEWNNNKEICKSIIRSILGKIGRKIHARKCFLEEISNTQCRDFYENNHLLKAPRNFLANYGLFFDKELVAAITLSRHHRASKKLVLSRLCFLKDAQVIGGAGKLVKPCIKYAKENNFSTLITWSDNRWSSGNVYGKIGFTLEKELPPDYSYVDVNNSKIRLSKQSCKKSNKDCPVGKTECEWMAELGYARMWDCGELPLP